MTAPTNHRLAERSLIALVREGQWEIDAEGRIWRTGIRTGCRSGGSYVTPVERRRVEKVLPAGYMMVRAVLGGRRVAGLAHRLVWQHLHGDIPEGLVINHINGRKGDNRPDNLEVASYSRNAAHAYRVLGVNPQHGQHNPMAKLSPSDVAEVRAALARGEKATDLAARFGVRFQHIYRISSGERWGHLANPDLSGVRP